MSVNMTTQPRMRKELDDDRAWSNKETRILRANWGKLSMAALGKLFTPERSKHSIVGKGHRLKLPDLGNPVGKSPTNPSMKIQAAKQPAPVVVVPLTEEEIEWKTWTHWEPGDPSRWEDRTHETEIYRRGITAVFAWHGILPPPAASGPEPGGVVQEPPPG